MSRAALTIDVLVDSNTAAGDLDKVAGKVNTWGNRIGKIGAGIGKFFSSELGQKIIDGAIDAGLEAIGASFGRVMEKAKTSGGAVGDAANKWDASVGMMAAAVQGSLDGAITAILPLLADFAAWGAVAIPAALDAAGGALNTIGPILTMFGSAIGAVFTWINENPETFQIFAVTLGVLAAAVGVATGAQWLWNAALTANPIGLVILGIAALVAAGVWLYTNWDKVTAAVGNALTGIGRWFTTTFDQVKTTVTTGIQNAITTVTEFPSKAASYLLAGISGFSSAAARLVDGFVQGIIDGAGAVARAAADLARRALSALTAGLIVSSPSKAAYRIAQWFGPGVANAIDDSIPGVEASGRRMSDALLDAADPSRLRIRGPIVDQLRPAGATPTPGRTYSITLNVAPTADKVSIGRELVAAIKAFEQVGGR